MKKSHDNPKSNPQKSAPELQHAKDEKQRQREENFRTAIERVSDAFVALDNHWCYTYMNKRAGEIFRVDPEAMIGKHIWTEFPEGID
jgi:PAS domain-containing protein